MADLGREVALVTGAGAGLGRAVTIALAEAGAEVVAVSLNPDELRELESEVSERGLDVLTLAADVGSESDTERVARHVLEVKGRVDVLVNNAGVIEVKPLTDTTVPDWDRVLATNLRGVFLYTASFLGGMKERRHGVILNVSSRAGVRGRANGLPSRSVSFSAAALRTRSSSGSMPRPAATMSIADSTPKTVWMSPGARTNPAGTVFV